MRKGITWFWCKEYASAFRDIKKIVSSPLILAHYDPKFPLRLTVDAFDYGISIVLSHKFDDELERLLGFASRMLLPCEKKYFQLDKEALAIIFGLKKFHVFHTNRHDIFFINFLY